ncbi:hypothetical protein I4U23_026305 [Adineta vaga]|nr:hypothetical protein I4U23_026305 [Adineta vaga]
MKKQQRTYHHIFDRNKCTDDTQNLYLEESPPPPYSSCVQQQQQQPIENDWKDEIIEITPLSDFSNKYGFVISGGIDTIDGRAIVITHIEHCSNALKDNGRSKLRLFDRILSMNRFDFTHITHDNAAQAFSCIQGQCITLHIRRVNPLHIEYVDFLLTTDSEDQPLGITIRGGLDEANDDCGLFITQIDPNGFIALNTKKNQVQIGDRLLEIKTNRTSANLQWVTHSMAAQLIRQICNNSRRVTLVVARRTSNF